MPSAADIRIRIGRPDYGDDRAIGGDSTLLDRQCQGARTGCVQREFALFVCGALPIQRVGELGARAEKEPGP